jgi:hypothetical protein
MIRYFPSFFNPNSNNFSEIDIFYECQDSFHPEKARCPDTRAKNVLKYHSSYERDLITYDKGVIVKGIIVKRYECSSCGKMHSVVHVMCIPYGSYSLLFVLKVLKTYFTRKFSGCTVVHICEKYQIAASTLYEWKKRFKNHKMLWLGVTADQRTSEISFLSAPHYCFRHLRDFFFRFGFSFLQNRLFTTKSKDP